MNDGGDLDPISSEMSFLLCSAIRFIPGPWDSLFIGVQFQTSPKRLRVDYRTPQAKNLAGQLCRAVAHQV